MFINAATIESLSNSNLWLIGNHIVVRLLFLANFKHLIGW